MPFRHSVDFHRCLLILWLLPLHPFFQGDHGGVEFATSGHEGLLKSWGCLDSSYRMTSDRPMPSDTQCEGLVIDDYYAVSVEPKNGLSDAWSSKRADAGKVIGAALNSSDGALSCNVVTVAAPLPKRLALSWICLHLSLLRASMDGPHVCLVGGLVSAMLYRRPFMGLLNKSFNLVHATCLDASQPRVIRLPASVCEELTLAAVLMLTLEPSFMKMFLPRTPLRIREQLCQPL